MIRVLIRRRSDRPHLVLYFIDPLTGKEVWKSTGTADKSEALKAAGAWEQELLAKRGRFNDGWSFFRQRFEDEHLPTLAKKTRLGFGTALNHFERLIKNVTRVSDVTPSVVSKFQSEMLREGMPLTSVVTHLTHLRTALNWAEVVGLVHKAPKFSMPRTGKRKFMRGRPITETEYRIFLKTAERVFGDSAPAWRRFLELLWLSGFRLGEAMALSWDCPPVQVMLDAQPYPQLVFMLEGQKSRQDEAIPMTPELFDWLSKTPPKERRGLVAPIPLATVPRVSEAICGVGKEAGIEVNDKGKFASAHDFRRAFGTRWAAVVRPLTLQKIMRHANIETTLKYYVGLSTADAGADLWSAPTNAPKARSKSGKSA